MSKRGTRRESLNFIWLKQALELGLAGDCETVETLRSHQSTPQNPKDVFGARSLFALADRYLLISADSEKPVGAASVALARRGNTTTSHPNQKLRQI